MAFKFENNIKQYLCLKSSSLLLIIKIACLKQYFQLEDAGKNHG